MLLSRIAISGFSFPIPCIIAFALPGFTFHLHSSKSRSVLCWLSAPNTLIVVKRTFAQPILPISSSFTTHSLRFCFLHSLQCKPHYFKRMHDLLLCGPLERRYA